MTTHWAWPFINSCRARGLAFAAYEARVQAALQGDPTEDYYRVLLLEDAHYLMAKLNQHQLSERLGGMATETLRHLVNGWWLEVRARRAERLEGRA